MKITGLTDAQVQEAKAKFGGRFKSGGTVSALQCLDLSKSVTANK